MIYRYIAIEGNIGAGKTTLAEKLSADLNAAFVPERFHDNVFLPRFYLEPDRYALALELSFLLDRNEQLSTLQRTENAVVADYTIDKCLVFASSNLPAEELALFKAIYMQYAAGLRQPDIILFLCRDTEKLQSNIRKRDRNYEKGISDEYLEKISESYKIWLSAKQDIPVLLVETDKLDFVANESDYLQIKELLNHSWQPGCHVLKF